MLPPARADTPAKERIVSNLAGATLLLVSMLVSVGAGRAVLTLIISLLFTAPDVARRP